MLGTNLAHIVELEFEAVVSLDAVIVAVVELTDPMVEVVVIVGEVVLEDIEVK